jgi:cytochrome c
MDRMTRRMCAAIALAIATLAAWADEPSSAGRDVYVTHCRTCHGGTGAPDLDIGPRLHGVVGAKAGTRAGGMYSRAVAGSAIVWDRDKLRRFLSVPRREIPGAVMPDIALEPAELESLLDYLETLR